MSIQTPLYLGLKNSIIQKIENNEYKYNEQIPTEVELTKLFNVSRITVTKALSELVKEKYVYRIVGKGTFVLEREENIELINEKNDHINTNSSKTANDFNSMKKIGIVFVDLSDNYSINILNACLSVFNNKFNVFIKLSSQDKDVENNDIRELISMGVSGIILFPVDQEMYNDEILKMKLSGFPLVLVDRFLTGLDTSYVVSDNYQSSENAVRYLHKHGHRKIGFVTSIKLPITTKTVMDRLNGYKETAKKLGIDDDKIFDDSYYSDIGRNHKKLEKAILDGEVTALISSSTGCTAYIRSLVEKLGKKIPDDISVVTYDSQTDYDKDIGFYTFINQKPWEIGELSAKILISKINDNQNQNQNQQMVIKSELIEKHSVKRILSSLVAEAYDENTKHNTTLTLGQRVVYEL